MTDLQNTPPEDAVVLVNLQKLLKAQEKLASANGELRALNKHLDGKSIHLGAAKTTVSLMKKNDDEKLQEIILEMTRTIQYLEIAGFKLTQDQKDLFDLTSDDPDAEPIIDKAAREGRNAGLLGLDEADCPHAAGTDASNAWLEAFRQGEEERKAVLAMEPRTTELVPGPESESDNSEEVEGSSDDADDALADGDG